MFDTSSSGSSWGVVLFLLILFLFWGGGLGGIGGARTALAAEECSNTMVDRDVLELKCTMTSQNALMTQQMDNGIRDIIQSQDAGFAALRTQMLEDQIRTREMTLMAQNSEIMSLKNQLYTDGKFNALERMVESGFCNSLQRPPFFPYGCVPCPTANNGCGC